MAEEAGSVVDGPKPKKGKFQRKSEGISKPKPPPAAQRRTGKPPAGQYPTTVTFTTADLYFQVQHMGKTSLKKELGVTVGCGHVASELFEMFLHDTDLRQQVIARLKKKWGIGADAHVDNR